MRDDSREISPEVIAAHEAGHAVAAIVYGASFRGIQIIREGNAVAQNLDVTGLSDVGYARTFLAGTAGEEIALGRSDPDNARRDQDLMVLAIKDLSVLAFGHPRAIELLQRYRAAHDAVRQLILDELERGATDVIPAEQIIEVARLHGTRHGAEEPKLSASS